MKAFISRSLLFAALAVASSCMKNPAGLPEPEGYDGFIAQGWQAVQQGRHAEALDWFQQAIALDVGRADGYLGAGVSCIFIEDCWGIADSYFQAAVQQDMGTSAVVRHLDQSLTQDTLWTVFQCVDPDLPQDSLDSWLALTADSGSIWVGQTIRDYLVEGGFDTSLDFRFQPGTEDPVACLELYNIQSGGFYSADSISSGYVHFTVPMKVTSQGMGSSYYTWIMADQGVRFDYAVFHGSANAGQITLDALAAWVMLQEVRYPEGDLLMGVACSQGLLQCAPDYLFGKGEQAREGVFDTDIVEVVASAASQCFLGGNHVYSWHICREAGYGLELDPLSPTFLLELLELISWMQGGQ